MRQLIVFLKGAISILAIFSWHTVIAYSAPYPIYQLHGIYLFLVWLLINSQKTKALWLGLIFGYMSELFSAEIFGVHTLTLIISLVAVDWLIEKIFTNQTWYIITIIGVVATILYRLIFIGISLASRFFTTLSSYSALTVLESIAVEAAVNTLGLLLVYGVSKFFKKKTNSRYA